MCGVAAIFAYHPVAQGIDRDELLRIRDHMTRRGPDGLGEWISADGRIGLAHRRLSIIDLSQSGAQPMSNEDGTLWIVFNGEIYNYQPLRQELIRKGHQFKSTSDTEVLLHLYEEEGADMVHRLRGMFAFALWDSNKGAMLLARDPYGIKPLYYADDGWSVRVASQVKAIVAGGRVSRLSEPAGIVGFYLFGSVPEPFTMYQEVRAVPAGSYIWVNRFGAGEPNTYFSVAAAFREASETAKPLKAEEARHSVREALLDSVRHHLIADVPVGAFLSAGIDSSSLVGLARECGYNDLRTVTLGFTEYQDTANDEPPVAAEVARKYRTNHAVRALDQAEFHRDLSRIMSAMDQPSIDGINTYYVSKSAAERGLKVALSGLGGDELFGGYPSFHDLPQWVSRAAIPSSIPGFGRVVRRTLLPVLPQKASPKTAGIVEFGGTYPGAYLLRRGLFMPWELGKLLGNDLAHEGLRRLQPLELISRAIKPDPQLPYARVASLEASLYMRNQLLRDADWSSMAHSLEVRVPLVDAQLLRDVASILCCLPLGNNKKILAGSVETPLPSVVSTRVKTGFSIPIGTWLESSSVLDVWKKVPALTRPGTHWARRWAYALANLGAS